MGLKIGLRGSGKWSRNIVRTLAEIGGADVRHLAKEAAIDKSLDGVIVANRSSEHALAALPYIEAGVATFIEKPMTTSVSDANLLKSAAVKRKAPVFVGHICLFNNHFEKLLSTASEMKAIESATCRSSNNRVRADGSVLWDWLPHCLSMLMPLFGRLPESVSAWGLAGGTVPHAAIAKYTFGNRYAICDVSWTSHLPEMKLTVSGRDESIVFDDKAAEKVVRYQNGKASPISVETPSSPLTNELTAFLKVARDKDCANRSLNLAIFIASCIEATQTSIDMNGAETTIGYSTDPALFIPSISALR